MLLAVIIKIFIQPIVDVPHKNQRLCVCVCVSVYMYEHLLVEPSRGPYIYPTKTAAIENPVTEPGPALQLQIPATVSSTTLCMFCKSAPSPNSLCNTFSHQFSISFSGGSQTDAGTPVPAARSRWIRALLRSAQPGMCLSGPLINQWESHWVLISVHDSQREAPTVIVVNTELEATGLNLTFSNESCSIL